MLHTGDHMLMEIGKLHSKCPRWIAGVPFLVHMNSCQIGYENLEPAQQQYVMQLEQAKQLEEVGETTWEVLKGVGVGLYDVAKDTVTGVKDLAVGA